MTKNERKELKFIWKLENYSYCWNKTDDFLKSPDFEMDVFEGSSWCLKLYPRGISSYENYLSVHLERLASSKGPIGITIDYEISLLRPDGTVEYVRETKQRSFKRGYTYGFNNLAPREEILGLKKSVLMPEDIFTVQCRISPKGAELKSCTEVIAKTHLELERFVFLWESENRFLRGWPERYHLELFNGREKQYFKLHRYRSGGLEYQVINFEPTAITKAFRVRVRILDSNDSLLSCLVDNHYVGGSREIIKLITVDEMKKKKTSYLRNKKLTLHCDFTFCFGVHHSQIEVVACDNSFPIVPAEEEASSKTDVSCSYSDKHASLQKDIQDLYEEGTLCDFILKVGNEAIQAHKAVLCARSPVFKAMLTSNMKENENSMVEISDLEIETVRCILLFMYTDTIDDLDWDIARDLYFAADKYDMPKLKLLCSNALKRNLCVANVGEVLALANMHADDDLKKMAFEFIFDNEAEAMCSPEWITFMSEEVQLAADVMHSIILRKFEIFNYYPKK